MKRLVVLLFGLVGAALFMSAANSGDRVLRDSIFHVYRSMPADTTRTVFAKEAAMGHVKESWALELLDSALVFAREIKDVEGELELQYGIFRYYTFRMDGENMEKTCATLREACYRYKKYDNYFLALHYVLQLKGSKGDTEYAITLMIPTLIASFYGMNVDIHLEEMPHAFLLIILVSVFLSALSFVIFRKIKWF